MGLDVITGEQVKAARRLLGWSQDKLAGHAGVSATSVLIAEKERKEATHGLLRAIVAALEEAGVEFPDGEPPRLKGE